MRLGVTNPIHAGNKLASYNASSVNDTDWHSLSSTDFYDAQTGIRDRRAAAARAECFKLDTHELNPATITKLSPPAAFL